MKHFERHSLAQWWALIKRSAQAWSEDYAPSMGAALSYYSVFSMAPLLLLVISIAGLVFGQEAARGELFSALQGLMGADAAKTLQDMLAAMSKPAHGLAGTAISIGALVVGATSVFGELQNSLDRIWRAPDRSDSGGIWALLRSRILSFGMILGIAFLLMVSLVATAAVSALGKWWGGFFGEWEALLHAVNLLVGFVITTAGFALIYKFMPRVKVHWHDVGWGAAITAVLFTVGKFLIGLYIGKTGVASGFGAAGSIAVVFVWVYYSAQIFLFGAEFTWIYAQMFGSLRSLGIAPAADAALPPVRAEVPAATLAARHPTLASRLETAPARSSAQPASAPALDKAALAKWGLGMAAGIAVQHLLPKLLLRLAVGRVRRVVRPADAGLRRRPGRRAGRS